MIHSTCLLSEDACTQERNISNGFIRKISLTETSAYINGECTARSLNSHDGRDCSVNGRCPIVYRNFILILFCLLNRLNHLLMNLK